MKSYIDFFDEYVCKGLMPIAVCAGTKVPASKEWNKNWCSKSWRRFFVNGDKYEIGLLWNNGMVDIEADTKESNEFLNRLIGNVRRPVYKSYRSYHNIFLTPHKELKKANLFGKKGEKIEIFGKRTFTIAPPSRHVEQNVLYEFIDDYWPPPECPNSIKSLYFSQRKVSSNDKKITNSVCQDCQVSYPVHKKRLMLEVRLFLTINMGWKCIKCRKKYPIDIKESRRKLRDSLRKNSWYSP